MHKISQRREANDVIIQRINPISCHVKIAGILEILWMLMLERALDAMNLAMLRYLSAKQDHRICIFGRGPSHANWNWIPEAVEDTPRYCSPTMFGHAMSAICCIRLTVLLYHNMRVWSNPNQRLVLLCVFSTFAHIFACDVLELR